MNMRNTWNVKPHFIHSHKNGKTFLFVLVTMLCFEITVSLAKAISKYFCIFVVVNKVSVYFLYKYVLHSVVSISIRILTNTSNEQHVLLFLFLLVWDASYHWGFRKCRFYSRKLSIKLSWKLIIFLTICVVLF